MLLPLEQMYYHEDKSRGDGNKNSNLVKSPKTTSYCVWIYKIGYIIYWMVTSPIYNLQYEERWYACLSPVDCILDKLPSNICHIVYSYLHNLNLLLILTSDWEN